MRLDQNETKIFRQLSSPEKIQDFLDKLQINFEKSGETCSSPRTVLERGSAHCIEAALLGAAAMIFHNQTPLLLDLRANSHDFDHVVLLFKKNNLWGAISKSNHAVLRYREPVYGSVRELAMSYFHEYLNDSGEKTLRSFSRPFSLKKYGNGWITSPKDLWKIANDLDEARHFDIIPKKYKLRRADKIEVAAGKLTEWSGKTGKMVKYK